MFRGGQGVVRRPRVATMLAALSLIPLIGLTWLAFLSVNDATDERTAAEDYARATDEAVLVVNLEAALDLEQTYAQGISVAGQLGLPSDLIVGLLGLDLEAEFAEAVGWVDDLVEQLDEGRSARLAAPLAAARDMGVSAATMADRYAAVRLDVEEWGDTRMRDLLLASGTFGDSGMTTAGAIVLDGSATLRSAFTSQVGALFSHLISDLGIEDDPLAELVTADDVYDAEIVRLQRLVPPESAAARRLVELVANPAVSEFHDIVHDVVDDVLSGTPVPAVVSVSAAGEAAIDAEGVDRLVETFVAVGSGSDAHNLLVAEAGEDVRDLVAAEAEDARSTALWLTVAAIAIAGLTVAATLATVRAIVRPLSALASSTEALRRGDLSGEVPIAGPREVHSVGSALAEAVENMRLGERQADALAVGSLDDPAFDIEARGRFGSSIQAAVDRLRVSLAEREEYRRRLSHQAAHDALTGLPNRRAVIEHLEHAVARTTRTESVLAAFFLDIDSFKTVNDGYGHPAGDELLRTVAVRLSEAVRGGDLVGRVGGDEFLVVAEPVADEADAFALAERIRAAVTRPVETDAGVVEPTVSIGVAVSVAGSFSADELIRDADLAVYLAKDRGRDRTEVCDDRLRHQALREADLDRAIRHGLANGEFTLHYQPVVESGSGDVVAVEALIRWLHPDHGLVGPGEFIWFAERSDLIVDVDRWVIRTAVAQLAAWQRTESMSELALSVNVSGRHLRGGTLPADVREALSDSPVDPSHLIVEITESALLHDLEDVAADLATIRSLGVRVAIDDFGTGYTSLAHLRTLPLDILKLDQSFVATLETDDRSIVSLVVETAHLLGMRVVVEGVETVDQAKVVRELGSDLMQGYLFGHPVPGPSVPMAITAEISGRVDA